MTTFWLVGCVFAAYWVGYISAVLDARRYLIKHLKDLV